MIVAFFRRMRIVVTITMVFLNSLLRRSSSVSTSDCRNLVEVRPSFPSATRIVRSGDDGAGDGDRAVLVPPESALDKTDVSGRPADDAQTNFDMLAPLAFESDVNSRGSSTFSNAVSTEGGCKIGTQIRRSRHAILQARTRSSFCNVGSVDDYVALLLGRSIPAI